MFSKWTNIGEIIWGDTMIKNITWFEEINGRSIRTNNLNLRSNLSPHTSQWKFHL